MKVLILSASIGGGHVKAAKALESNILSSNEHNVIKIVDALEYVSPILNKTVAESYSRIIKIAPKMFSVIYKNSNKDGKFESFVVFLNYIFSRKIQPLLKKFDPDVVISTHMFPTEMVSALKAKRKVKAPLVCVITDYAPHKTWIAENVDAYIVASKDMIPKMREMGINEEKIYPFGIPVDNLFFTKRDKASVLKELKLNTNIPTVLIMAGSFGVNGIMPIYANLVKSNLEFQIIVITGKNKKLYEKLSKFIENERRENENFKKTKLIYFTNEVHKFMKASDLIITKPGGLTVSEALASGLPMAVFDAIPGQEEENADFVIKNNMGIKISKNENCFKCIEELLKDRKSLEIMKSFCKVHSDSMSNEGIYLLVKKLAKAYKANSLEHR